MQRRIGDYKIISELGTGAMAAVFSARRERAKAGFADRYLICKVPAVEWGSMCQVAMGETDASTVG